MANVEQRDEEAAVEPSYQLKHFVRLARQGKHRGSSGGEKTARKLAEVFLDGSAIDDAAIQGFCEFMQAARSIGYWEARQLIGG